MKIPYRRSNTGEIILPTVVMPPMGNVAVRCSCGHLDFAIYGKNNGPDVLVITELVCVTCRKRYKTEGKAMLDRRGREGKESDASQRHFFTEY